MGDGRVSFSLLFFFFFLFFLLLSLLFSSFFLIFRITHKPVHFDSQYVKTLHMTFYGTGDVGTTTFLRTFIDGKYAEENFGIVEEEKEFSFGGKFLFLFFFLK